MTSPLSPFSAMAGKTPVAIYARYSTDRQDARSIDDQVRRCRKRADEAGLEVVEVYKDEAKSGASLARADLQRLLAEVEGGRRCRFRLVLVDDLSRLSRDLGDMFRTVFRVLPAAGVVLLDCQTGMRSDQRGARLMFGASGLVNDAFLEMVRDETHRGLEGRALAGFWPGGRCYGYRTVLEPNPPAAMRPRAMPVIDLNEAKVVRRVFEAYSQGTGLREIADQLNREGVPAPYDRGGYQKQGKGWGHTTIRAILRNERYVGRFRWNKRRWVKTGSDDRRIPQSRPKEEWVLAERPDLAIVGPDLWDAVAARFKQRTLGRPKGGRRKGYQTSPVSGLLRCGTCGSRMSVAGQSSRGGVRYRRLGCSANHSKGALVCANGHLISERKAMAGLLATVRQSLKHPKFRDRFEATFTRLWKEQEAAPVRPRGPAAEVTALEEKIARLVGFIEDGHGDVESLGARLRELEGQKREASARSVATAPTRPAAGQPPPLEAVLAEFDDLDALFDEGTDPIAARAALEARFEPVVLTPEPDGYHLRTALKLEPAALVRGGRQLGGVVGCGGRI